MLCELGTQDPDPIVDTVGQSASFDSANHGGSEVVDAQARERDSTVLVTGLDLGHTITSGAKGDR